MPGITGLLNRKHRERNSQDLGLMIKTMTHEPWYRVGSYVNEEIGLYLGWTCQDGSFSDCNPIVNERNDLILIISGEIFSDHREETCLKSSGHAFNPGSAEYLVHLYEEEGKNFFRLLNGWFSGVIVDIGNKTVTLFNDRYGMGRVYYHEEEEGLLFSSEAKSILKIRKHLRNIDIGSLGEYISYGCVTENKSLFPKIDLIPGGSRWTIREEGSIEKASYFSPAEWERQSPLDEHTFIAQFSDIFRSKLPQYFEPRQRIGLSLTSGMDSRAIIANLVLKPGELPCYTYSGNYRETYDVQIARRVAEKCLQKHSVIHVDDAFLRNFGRWAEKTIYITDGCHDVLGAHDYHLNKLSRAIAPIRMTGKFGSEILWDHSSLKKTLNVNESLFEPEVINSAAIAKLKLESIKKKNPLSFAVFNELPWYEYGRLSMEMAILTLRTPYMDNDIVSMMYRAPKNLRSTQTIRLKLIENGNPELLEFLTHRGRAGNRNFLSSAWLQFIRYAMFKAEYIYLYQLPTWMAGIDPLVSALNMEKWLVGRYQYLPYRLWFQGTISEYVKDVLLDSRTFTRPYLKGGFLKTVVRRSTNGQGNYLNEVNKVLTIELIYRLLVECP